MNLTAPLTMTADEFLAWGARQPQGRFELHAGKVVIMSPERNAHVLVKGQLFRIFDDAAAQMGERAVAYADGMAVRIDGDAVYEPDAMIRLGAPLADDALEVTDPVVVGEVLSPSSERRDTVTKLDGYFRLPTLRHYLILDTEERLVVHHARAEDGRIVTSTHSDGAIVLDPPGAEMPVADLFARLESREHNRNE